MNFRGDSVGDLISFDGNFAVIAVILKRILAMNIIRRI